MAVARARTSPQLGVAVRGTTLPGHGDLEVAGGAGPGDEGTDLRAELQPELDLHLLGRLCQGPQLLEQALYRWLDAAHRLLEALLRLLHDPLVAAPPPTGDLALRRRVVVDLDQHSSAASEGELHQSLAHAAAVPLRGHAGPHPTRRGPLQAWSAPAVV